MPEKFSMIIPAYKEGEKPVKLLETVEESDLGDHEIEEIYMVIHSDIEPIEKFSGQTDLPLTIIQEEERRGKASAINTALEKIETEKIVLSSADILLEKQTLRKLLGPLEEEKIGITTAHPVPLNSKDTFPGYFVNLLWQLHHLVSKRQPKAGEIIAFKNVIDHLPENTAADEEFIKSKILKRGYEASYVEEAIINNKGPESVSKLFNQRWRIFIGHLDLKKRTDYSAPSMRPKILLSSFFEYLKKEGLDPYFPLSVFFESLTRANAWISYKLLGRNPYIWKKITDKND